MPVTLIETLADFETALTAAGEKLVVVDFYAVWCGPCKKIAPKIQEWSDEMKDVVFLKVDVDDNGETAEKYDISAMPTFLLFKNGDKVGDVVGASEAKLKEKIDSHK
ncbi:thioredoxin-like [Lineus longissimus]|uniref:thioredoxin-like n=1 Tax=Lineus longissimus TaxID=88925 RepID=UPI002B4EBB49